MFEWLENTPVAIWVGESVWAYPMWLSLHVIGLAILVGIFATRDLRLLGYFSGLTPGSFLPLSKFAWIGFAVNAVSGVFLFISQATMFVTSTPFLLKISCIAAGLLVATVVQRRLRDELADAGSDAAISQSTKRIAAVSLSLWALAIINGRLIAYLGSGSGAGF
ncbi:MAG: hypothetical protein F4X96_08955 [Gammaproteobacteria bacterium]|nr:hypothetical protein [Gammaproteobacteria bacterium]